jgi:hypothetical protein
LITLGGSHFFNLKNAGSQKGGSHFFYLKKNARSQKGGSHSNENHGGSYDPWPSP